MIPPLLGLRQLACPEELPGGWGWGGMVSVKKKGWWLRWRVTAWAKGVWWI